jgi:hypothetical protein
VATGAQSKGYSVREGDVGLVLAIHNAVNEEGEGGHREAHIHTYAMHPVEIKCGACRERQRLISWCLCCVCVWWWTAGWKKVLEWEREYDP